MGTKEPIVYAFSFSSLLTAAGALAVYYHLMQLDEVGLWIAFLILVVNGAAMLWARTHVASEHTANLAGTSIQEIREVADNPNMMLVATGTGNGGPRI